MKRSKVAAKPIAASLNHQSNDADHLFYHYTTQEGLLGIFNSECLWASHIQYLNDSTEGQSVSEFLDGFVAAFQKVGSPRTRDADHRIRLRMKSLSETMKAMIASHDIFVTSFSEFGDLLSQWRAYAGTKGGFSIGFTRSSLKDMAAGFISKHIGEFYDDIDPLFRCHYRSNNSKAVSTVESSIQPDGHVNKSTDPRDLPKTLLRTAVALKHHSFVEEAEWRLAFLLREKSWSSAVKFRPGNSMPVPYIEIPFGTAGLAGIRKIIVGPSPHRNEAIHAVELLLKKHKINGVSVEPSDVPYRNW